MTTIRESGFVLKIATGQAIGITNEADLDPSNMSSGSALSGQVLAADGSGGAAWSTETGLGDVSGPASSTDGGVVVFDGTGGKTIKAPTAAVNFGGQQATNLDQSNLTPASMSSGAATSGQLLTAGGGGATSWQDPPASINLPGSSTDNALTRWDGAGGDTVADSVVTLSDAGAMVFPAAGSISKPGAGAGSEVFGSGSTAAGSSAVAVGNGVAVASNDGTAVGAGADIGASCVGAVAIGQNATVIEPNADDTSGAITIGKNSRIGEASQAGSLAAVCVGEAATIGFNADNGICMGAAATIGDNCQNTMVLGPSASVVDGVAQSVVIGRGANIFDAAGDQSVIIGDAANGNAGLQTALGGSVNVRQTRATGVGYGAIANGDSCTALGTAARIDGHADAICIGPSARINPASSGDSAACILMGHNATVSAGAGVDAAIGIGESVSVIAGATRSVAIGRSAQASFADNVCVGREAVVNTASTGDSQGAIALGAGATVGSASGSPCDAAIAIGNLASVKPDGNNSIAIGPSALVGKSDNAIAIGNGAFIGTELGAVSTGSIAIGNAANVDFNGLRCIAIGNNAEITPATLIAGSIAIGDGCDVDANASVGIGGNVLISSDSAAAVAIGNAARVQTGDYGVAIGASATVIADRGIAIGDNADALTTHDESVAIGRDAKTTAASRVTLGTIGGAYDLELQCGKGLGVWGVTPPASQPLKISDPTGGATQDAEARTAINAIIDVLEGAGFSSST